MNGNILIFISRLICYESNSFFVECMSKEFKELGYSVEICELDMKENMGDILEGYIGIKYKAIIDFNSTLPRILIDDGMRYIDMLDGPFYNYIVDHPLYHHPVIKIKLKNSNVICLDDNHKKYIKKYYPDIQSEIMLPIGGMKAVDLIPFNERTINVMFPGTYTSSDELLTKIKDLPEYTRNEVENVLEILKINPNLTQEEALTLLLKNTEKKVTKVEFREIMNSNYLVDMYLRAYYRELVLKELLNAKIKVNVFGHGWKNFECDNKEYLIINRPVSFPISLEIMANSKIVLNVMPWFKAGAHDRVFSAMANEAVCLTDSSKYIEKNFKNNKDIALYSLEELDKLPVIVMDLLSNDKKAIKIAKAGNVKVCKKHMWKNRIEEFCKIIERPYEV